jgi:hypothetical protein
VNTLEGGTQATWTSTLTFNTSYWLFDGSVGPVWSKTPSQYGFKIGNPTIQYALSIYNTSIAISNITISHVAATAPSGDIQKMWQDVVLATQSINYVTISHSYGNGYQNFVRINSANLLMESWVIEYNVFLNGNGSATWHSEDINNDNGNANNLTIRYNWFEGRGAGGSTGSVMALNYQPGPYLIYGNVWKDMMFGNGLIAGNPSYGSNHFVRGVVYNNTFINCQYTPYNRGWWIGMLVQSTVQNNLVANSMADLGSSAPHDYNAYFNTTNTPSETHGQVASGNPFTNYTAGDVSLVAPTSPGTTLPSPYNVDAFGHVRGADGVWDRGAIEYVSGGTSIKVPSAPILL